MKSKLELLHEMTGDLVSDITDTTYVDFEFLIELREETIRELGESQVITESDKQKLMEIELHHGAILEKMISFRDEASVALDKIKRSKAQKNRYESQQSYEGFFIDKKK